ncbi:MAG TPA: glycosyltransferase family 9 protein [Flavipsychrobacter sp.]|nr:glycosyltransferase family 9 protein [Flavipsychrobacter sp.]
MQAPKNIIISRTDSIGDVILTLPVAKVLKDHFPEIKIAFLGRNYTKPVIDCCEWVDDFIELNDFLNKDAKVCGEKPDTIIHVFPVKEIARRAKALGIPSRIGTTNRFYHWTTCNKLLRLSRKNSELHEAQLNLKLLQAFNIQTDYTKEEISSFFGFTRYSSLQDEYKAFIHPTKYNLILHPKSQGSAREWGVNNFIALIRLLDKDKYNILISGTGKERMLLDELFEACKDDVTDITGTMNLSQFISFINHCEGLVANSTGPLHIAAVLNKNALGFYPSQRPMHPGRWAPLGKKVQVFVADDLCEACRKKSGKCSCMNTIRPPDVARAISLTNT